MPNLELRDTGDGFEALLDGKPVVAHSSARPLLRAGRGEAEFEMYRGNFQVSERLDELVALADCERLAEGEYRLSRRGLYPTRVALRMEAGRLVVRFAAEAEGAGVAAGAGGRAPNRYRITLPATAEEEVYGCGEQFSHFRLRGKVFPLWTSEQGVGRNKSTRVTWEADVQDKAGGDYWWTFYPQPSFASSRRLFYHLETSAWASFDFRERERHELYAWDLPESLSVISAPSMLDLARGVGELFGRQPELPDWAYDGVVLGIQGGTETCLRKLEAARAAGVPVAGIWAQDWEGINMTSFGQRLRWNWVWDRERYPGLDREIARLKAEGVRFLGYINPYVAEGRSLFIEAAAAGYLAKDASGKDYLVDFGEFDAGIVDFTNPAAVDWYKGVIRKELIEFGLSGWMADFGEYLPTDAVLHDGTPAELAHNAWPAVWARVNREACDESGRGADLVYFMRAGFTGSQRHCPLMWAGDQNVDWSKDDGLPSVIPAALSLAVVGHGLHHSDIGGYTTLFGMRRTKELHQRWAEQAALSPFMRGHEGNRPKDNWQFDSDAETLAHLGRMGRLHAALKAYLKDAVSHNAREGLPVMRPLFLHYEEDPEAWLLEDQYLLGAELLCSPVLAEGASSRSLHLPPGRWVHAWTGAVHESPGPAGRTLEVEAPIGEPPFFWPEGSAWASVFEGAVKAARA